jgi:hypothetical protein
MTHACKVCSKPELDCAGEAMHSGEEEFVAKKNFCCGEEEFMASSEVAQQSEHSHTRQPL